jgi:hypothetical protein
MKSYEIDMFEFWDNYEGDVYSLARTLEKISIEDVRAFYHIRTSLDN